MTADTVDEATRRRQIRFRYLFGALAVVIMIAGLFFTSSNSFRMEPGPVYPVKEATGLPSDYDLSDSNGDWSVLTVKAYPLNLIDELLIRISGRSETLYQAGSKDSAYTAETAAEAEAARQLSLNAAMTTITDGAGVLALESTDGTSVPEGSRLLSVNGQGPSSGPVPHGTWLVVEPDGTFAAHDVESDGVVAAEVDTRAHEDALAPLSPGIDAVSTSAFEMDEVGGSSGGLTLTLAWVDALTEGDLTDGRSIAATGTVDENGDVLPVAGVQFKLQAAAEADIDLVFVPEGYDGPVPDGLEVVPVKNVQDALEHLAV